MAGVDKGDPDRDAGFALCRVEGNRMNFLLYLSETNLIVRLHRIAGKDKPVSDDIGADTVLPLIRLNPAVDELTRAVNALTTRS